MRPWARFAAPGRRHAAHIHRPLLAVTDDPRGSLEAPEGLAGLGVERLELAIHDTGKHEIARRHQGR